jgi:hypothetical protein
MENLNISDPSWKSNDLKYLDKFEGCSFSPFKSLEKTPEKLKKAVSEAARRSLVGRLWSQTSDENPSPPRSPVIRSGNASVEDSPRRKATKEVCEVIRDNELGDSLLPSDQKKIKIGSRFLRRPFQSVDDCSKRARYAQEIQDAIIEQGNVPQNENGRISISGEELFANLLHKGDPWVKEVTFSTIEAQRTCSPAILEQYPPRITTPIHNWGHIRKADSGGGFHFCPSIHEHYSSLQKIATNSENGVFIAEFPYKTKTKISSFFPPSILALEELQEILKGGEKIAQTGNKELMRVVYEEKSIYVEQYIGNKDEEDSSIRIINSFFPIFFYDLLDGGKKEFVIGEKSFDLNTIQCLLKGSIESKIILDVVKYKFKDRVIVDLGEAIGFSFKGVYFETTIDAIPKELRL